MHVDWENYGFSEGLGAPVPASAKAFQPLPIEGSFYSNALCVTGTDEAKTIWAGSYGPMIRSDDHGANWEVLEESIESFQDIRVMRRDGYGGMWVLTGGSTVVYSPDEGSTWEIVIRNTELPLNTDFVDFAFASDSVWFSANGIQQHYIMKASITERNLSIVASFPGSVDAFAASADGLYIATRDGILRSQDGGVSFSPFHQDGSNRYYRVLVTGDAVWCVASDTNDVSKLSLDGDVIGQTPSGLSHLRMTWFGDTIWGNAY